MFEFYIIRQLKETEDKIRFEYIGERFPKRYVSDEYFYSVYFWKYKDIGLDFDEIQDISVLDYFGLSPGASINIIWLGGWLWILIG